jgi:hypothetical protein
MATRKSTMDSAVDGTPGFLLSAYSSPTGLVHPAKALVANAGYHCQHLCDKRAKMTRGENREICLEGRYNSVKQIQRESKELPFYYCINNNITIVLS